MWVKICANTNLKDALMAAELGADAVGFVFAPSVRQVTPELAASISPHLPAHVDRVGVFPAWAAEQIVAAVTQASLTIVQLHGDFDPELVRSLRHRLQPGTPIIQVVHWAVDQTIGEMENRLSYLAVERVDRVLVDSKVGTATGGTGVPFDWAAAKGFFPAHPGLILAGGLDPQNVREAITQLNPWGVDVASGVEAVVGRKDRKKLAEFITSAKQGGSWSFR